MPKFHHSFSVYQNSVKIIMQHLIKYQNNKYITNYAENIFRADKMLIIS